MRTGDAGPTVAQRQHGHKQNTERRWTRRTLRPATRLLHRQHPSNSGTRALAHSSAQRDVYASPLSRGSGTSQQWPTRFASNPHPRRAGITYARAYGRAGLPRVSALSPSLISICVRGYSGAAPPKRSLHLFHLCFSSSDPPPAYCCASAVPISLLGAASRGLVYPSSAPTLHPNMWIPFLFTPSSNTLTLSLPVAERVGCSLHPPQPAPSLSTLSRQQMTRR